MERGGGRERKGFVWRVLARHVSASLLPSMHPPRVSRPRDDMGVYICPFIDTARLLANNAEENRRATLHHEQSTTGLIPLARAFAGECCCERGIYRRKCHWNSVESAVLKFLFLIDLFFFNSFSLGTELEIWIRNVQMCWIDDQLWKRWKNRRILSVDKFELYIWNVAC